ncbi:hypothetical protein H2200_008947 [Cladophialophora chaetospira]|uniref:Uncharacterized protein n=1 Tax=Cladophialophora chaetospira TaxID=386627 RepID=A0AA38X518_9EURO|nr:hypothetical protein H2200_008947 [Cladophialophora chaetospira]
MRALTLLTGALSSLQRRGDYDNGQYTQIVQATVWTSTPTYVVSYISTQIVTLTSYIPCQVTTSYTTIYECSTCGPCNTCGAAPTTCAPKLCATQVYDVVQATTTQYSSGEIATAYVTNNNGASYTTTVPASLCTAYAQVNLVNYDCAALPTCGGGVIPPVNHLVCDVKPCTTYGYLNGNSYLTLTEGTSYAFTEYAYLTVNGVVTSTPASLCAELTTPNQWAIAPTCACGSDGGGGVITTTGCTGGGGQVLTYTYTTQGSTIIVATTLPCRGGPFHLTGGGSGRVGGDTGKIIFWVWTICAIFTGVGMVVL